MDKIKCLSLFNQLGFTEQQFNELAKAVRFKSRFRSLMAFDFVFVLLVSSIGHCASYNNMARNLSYRTNVTVSKQALQKAMIAKGFLLFIRVIFRKLLAEKLKKTSLQIYGSIGYLKEYWFRIALL